MFCKKCGKMIADNTKFCSYCGTEISGAETAGSDRTSSNDPFVPVTNGADPETVITKDPSQGKKGALHLGFAVIAASVFAAIGLIILLVIGGSRPAAAVIDLNDYVGIVTDGYDGYGTAQSEFYFQEYQSSVIQALSDNGLWDSDSLDGQQRVLIDRLLDAPFSYALDKETGLSNGDNISIVFTIRDESFRDIGINLKGESRNYEVSGLTPTQETDPFSGFTIEFSGISPFCSASWHGGLPELTYHLDKSEDLKIGDTVTVTVDYLGQSDFSEFTQRTGLVPTKTEKVYTVKNIDSYAMSTSDLTNDLKNKMDKVARDSMTAYAATWDTPSSYKGMDFLGYYYLKPKNNDSWRGSHFYLYLVYKVNVVENEGSVFHYYNYWSFEDPMILADGTCTCNLDDYERCHNSFARNNLVYNGYTTLEGIFNDCVARNVAQYEYENTVQEDRGTPAENSPADSGASGESLPSDESSAGSTQE